ncbi:nucleopolyhedrovirus P10 family protein [Streptomyces sp. H10-C2]|uniref:nucleopolyhedrovirus P10 family protein n=1 Tax=unclassified Streptomyces TaxID=2593676 RepID=UPI0024BAA008|nr:MULTISPECIES: nucleopolyhedrovirus P10 family protein [unclassified Streptomyces]MDJ0346767.1 nucleopolyhedrovirus P10 family protein [Streptomyces sp. PH10-H1]MDJ0374077.1 nucleopolyhedrovirus P10 family protein [Streptomyces sp. H10-C2]
MESDGWAQSVRQQIGLGRLLPLGAPEDAAWITEHAATRVLQRAARKVPGIHLDSLRVALADPDTTPEPVVPAPASALPPGPLRIIAAFSASMRQPLPDTAECLRQALLAAAETRLGLDAAEVDLHVTGLLEGHGPTAELPVDHAADLEDPVPGPVEAEEWGDGLAGAAAAVPGVAHLAAALGRLAHPITVEDSDDPPRRHVQVQLSVAAAHRALDVARAVRAVVAIAAAGGAPGPVTVAVLVTAVEPGQRGAPG